MKLSARLQQHGLHLRGLIGLSPAEIDTYGFDAECRSLALVGNIGSSYWSQFSQSAEYSDGQPHPLDRWSRRVAEAIAQDFSLQALYPFEGPPYYPFQQWAHRAEALQQSPVGVMMHPRYGLWHSYRFALLGAVIEADTALPADSSPCLDCLGQPCLQTCPVGAFDAGGYDVDRCAEFLFAETQADCHAQGCLARKACPVATEYGYLPAQAAFHLSWFLNARR